MIKVGIIGGAGYTAGELLRILLPHRQVALAFVHSNSHAGSAITDVHRDLLGDTAMRFTDTLDFDGVDLLFLCNGHGKSAEFLEKTTLPATLRIIDLSQDFRNRPEYSGAGGGRLFVYGLPEWNREAIKQAHNIANPGCFATAFQLALLPLAAKGLLSEEVHVNGITGSTGAGQALSSTSHFSWRNNNISIYKPFTHQHLIEVRRHLAMAANQPLPAFNFLPVRGDFTRGIFLTAYTACGLSAEELTALYTDYYKDAAFTFVSGSTLSLKEVVNTNKCFVQVEKYDDKALITCVIDNLVKGASGQAVQNMNLMFGFDEKEGLLLKPTMF